jgi:hypothetical protein
MQIELLAGLHPHSPEAIIEIDLGVDDNKSWVHILQKLSLKLILEQLHWTFTSRALPVAPVSRWTLSPFCLHAL